MGEKSSTLLKSCQNNCPLYYAIVEGDLKNIDNYIEDGHNSCTSNFETCMKIYYEKCLKIAAKEENWKVITQLLELDPTIINTRLDKEETLLIQNIQNIKRVKYLFDLGADVNTFITPINTDIQWESTENDILKNIENGGNSLHYALRNNTPLDIIKLLISFKVDVFLRGSLNMTCLMYAVQNLNLEQVKILIEAGSEIDAVNSKNQTALMLAAMNEKSEKIIEILLELGANVDICDDEGRTAFHFAAKISSLPIIKLLVEAKSDLLKEDMNFNTPLLIITTLACKNKRYDCLRYILCEVIEKSDVEKLQTRTIHPQEILYASYSLQTDSLFLNSELYDIIFNSPIKNVNRIIEMSLKFCSDSEVLEPRLFYFNFLGAYVKKITKMLLMYPHNMMLQDNMNWTPDDVKMALDKLIDYGFEVSPSDCQIISPLTVLMASDACYMWLKPSTHVKATSLLLQITKYLINKNVNFNQRIIKFQNDELREWSDKLLLPDALWAAATSGHWECVRYLLPFWTAPSLTLLIFMSPLSFNAMFVEDGIYTLYNILKLGGPLPMGTGLYEKVFHALEDMYYKYEMSSVLIEHFISMHSCVPSLTSLCRIALRGSMSSGRDLPQQLHDLVPPGLRDYIKLELESSDEDTSEG